MYWLRGVVLLGLDIHLRVDLLCAHAEEAGEITDESIHIAFPGCLVNDVLVVVVAQATRQLLVVHLKLGGDEREDSAGLSKLTDLRLVLSSTPLSRHLVWIDQFELPTIAGPTDARFRRGLH